MITTQWVKGKNIKDKKVKKYVLLQFSIDSSFKQNVCERKWDTMFTDTAIFTLTCSESRTQGYFNET